MLAHPCQPVRKPQRRRFIPSIGDERAPLSIGDQPIGERKGFEQHAMARAFIVEGEAFAFVTHQRNTARVLHNKVAASVLRFFADGHNRERLETLRAKGVSFAQPRPAAAAEASPVAGKPSRS